MIKKTALAAIVILLLSALPALAEQDSGWQYKPFSRNFPVLKADPRQVTMGVDYFSNPDRDNNGFLGKFGGFIAPLRYYDAQRNWTWQAELEGGAFALFDTSSGGSLESRATDYMIGLNLSWSNGPLAAQVRFFHLSSHPGDWHLKNEDPTATVVSWEAINGRLAWRPCPEFMAYGGGTWFPTHSEDIGSAAYQFGFEIDSPKLCSWSKAYFAADFQGREKNDWTPATSMQLGFDLGRDKDPVKVRMYVFYFTGYSPVSAFLDTWVNRFGVGFGVDW